MRPREWALRVNLALRAHRRAPEDWSLRQRVEDLLVRKPEPEPWFTRLSCTHLATSLLVYGDLPMSGAAEFCESIPSRVPLVLFLDCPGGDAEAAMDIHKFLRERGGTTAHVRKAHSAASMIAMGCERVVIQHDGEFLVHPARGSAVDFSPLQLRALADSLEALDGPWEQAYCRRTRQPVEVVREWLRGETVFRGAEAVKVGLADTVVANGWPADFIPPGKKQSAEVPDEALWWLIAQSIAPLTVADPGRFRAEVADWLREAVSPMPNFASETRSGPPPRALACAERAETLRPAR